MDLQCEDSIYLLLKGDYHHLRNVTIIESGEKGTVMSQVGWSLFLLLSLQLNRKSLLILFALLQY